MDLNKSTPMKQPLKIIVFTVSFGVVFYGCISNNSRTIRNMTLLLQ
jgi:hypothetical protein